MSIEKIIKDVEHIKDCCDQNGPWAKTLGEAIALLRTHPDAQPNEPKGDGWVSVDDRLPVGFDGMSICQNVIAYTVEGEVCTGWLNYKTWHLLCGNYDRYTKHGFGYVTHWRPLPEPPKEEHHEETP